MKVLSILAFLACAAIAQAPQRTRQQVVAIEDFSHAGMHVGMTLAALKMQYAEAKNVTTIADRSRFGGADFESWYVDTEEVKARCDFYKGRLGMLRFEVPTEQGPEFIQELETRFGKSDPVPKFPPLPALEQTRLTWVSPNSKRTITVTVVKEAATPKLHYYVSYTDPGRLPGMRR